jgi:hypothetical protein
MVESTCWHHTKYKEIDGVDEIVQITRSEHNLIHTPSVKNKLRIDKTIIKKAHSRKENLITPAIDFYETMCSNIRLVETIKYRPSSGSIWIVSRFQGNNGYTIKTIQGEHGN